MKQWRPAPRHASATARWLSAGVTTSTASTCGSACAKSATARARSTPCPIAHSRRSAETSATHTVAPSWLSTRRCFSPQRPRPTSRTFIARLLAAGLATEAFGHLVAQAVGDPRGRAAHDRVALATLHAPAGDRVPLLEMAQHGGNVVRVVLQVGVHRDDPAAARGLEAGVGGGGLAGVGLQPHKPHA